MKVIITRLLPDIIKTPQFIDIIKDYCNALKVKKKLQNAICGVLPFPSNQMSTTYVDEFNIRRLYGVEYKYLEISRLYQTAQKSSPDEIEDFKKSITENGYKVEIDERNLMKGLNTPWLWKRSVTQRILVSFA